LKSRRKGVVVFDMRDMVRSCPGYLPEGDGDVVMDVQTDIRACKCADLTGVFYPGLEPSPSTSLASLSASLCDGKIPPSLIQPEVTAQSN